MLSTSTIVAAVASLLLLAWSTSTVDATLCYSCATANTADKWGPDSSWRHMYKDTPLNITDECLHPGPSVSTVECQSSCFRVNYTETTPEDGRVLFKYTVRGCVYRMFQPHLSANAYNKTGCQASTIKSEELEKQTEICYCREDYCNSHATTGVSYDDAGRSNTAWIAISCLIVGLLLVSLIGCCLCLWKTKLEKAARKPFWVGGIFPAHAEHDTVSLMRFQCETAKI